MTKSFQLGSHWRVAGVLILLMLSGCATVTSSLTAKMAGDLADSIMNSTDVETIREGVPAYLIMIDSFLRSSPDDPDLLLAASSLNGAFSTFTTDDDARTRLLTEKSLAYALRAACIDDTRLCDFRQLDFGAFQQRVDNLQPRQVGVMYATGVAWTSWMQAHSDDWSAIAELAKVKYLMSRVLDLDETWALGGPHLYMGGLETILPASMGGKPEVGRAHFERAIAIADGRYLMTKVIFAEQYAKLTFDKVLYDELLNQVLAADPVVEGNTLTNVLAQQRAKLLLAESDDYF
ncbi:MAG: TRAP transporter TatT component family protein [Pseudomonadales bacterium]|nr:TRAP transporter TatT component family protein [Pseudomonadales bacterium]MDP4766003.1 TRAP transporter TatT component family protein [Pseudomonadales bacterium]MDP5059513.1 TRAP transporter TatT component family protein [Pseudomonadales bacterium]